MNLILLEKIDKLGNLGQVVKVRSGYGRNYLLPQKKAMPATKENLKQFETSRAALEQRQNEIKQEALDLAAKVAAVKLVLARPAGSGEKLFGSVTNSDVCDFFKANGLDIPRKAVELTRPVRTLGEHGLRLRLHPDVMPELTLRVERSAK